MGTVITVRRTVRPKNPKKRIIKRLVYKSDADGFVSVTSSKTVVDLTTKASDVRYIKVGQNV